MPGQQRGWLQRRAELDPGPAGGEADAVPQRSSGAPVPDEAAVGREGLRHLAEALGEQRAPGTPPGHEPVGRRAGGGRPRAGRRPRGSPAAGARPTATASSRTDAVGTGSRARRPGQRRPQDDAGQLAGQRPDLDRAGRVQHLVPVGVERLDVARKPRLGDPERPPDRSRLLVVPRPPRPIAAARARHRSP